MAVELGANLDRHLAAGGKAAATPAARLDGGKVLWRWLWGRIKALGVRAAP